MLVPGSDQEETIPGEEQRIIEVNENEQGGNVDQQLAPSDVDKQPGPNVDEEPDPSDDDQQPIPTDVEQEQPDPSDDNQQSVRTDVDQQQPDPSDDDQQPVTTDVNPQLDPSLSPIKKLLLKILLVRIVT